MLSQSRWVAEPAHLLGEGQKSAKLGSSLLPLRLHGCSALRHTCPMLVAAAVAQQLANVQAPTCLQLLCVRQHRLCVLRLSLQAAQCRRGTQTRAAGSSGHWLKCCSEPPARPPPQCCSCCVALCHGPSGSVSRGPPHIVAKQTTHMPAPQVAKPADSHARPAHLEVCNHVGVLPLVVPQPVVRVLSHIAVHFKALGALCSHRRVQQVCMCRYGGPASFSTRPQRHAQAMFRLSGSSRPDSAAAASNPNNPAKRARAWSRDESGAGRTKSRQTGEHEASAS